MPVPSNFLKSSVRLQSSGLALLQGWLSRALSRLLGNREGTDDRLSPPSLEQLLPRTHPLHWHLAALYVEHGLLMEPRRPRLRVQPWRYLFHLLVSALIGFVVAWWLLVYLYSAH